VLDGDPPVRQDRGLNLRGHKRVAGEVERAGGRNDRPWLPRLPGGPALLGPLRSAVDTWGQPGDDDRGRQTTSDEVGA